MKTALLAVLLAAAGAAAAAAAATKMNLTFKGPEGWRRRDYSNAGGADPVVKFEKGADSITVRQYGAKGSFYRAPEQFMSGPAATTMGKTPDFLGRIKVAGGDVEVYKREFPISTLDPHSASSAPERMGSETFCVLPAASDGRFAVLSWSRESPIPDAHDRGEKAWLAFLKTVAPAVTPKTKNP